MPKPLATADAQGVYPSQKSPGGDLPAYLEATPPEARVWERDQAVDRREALRLVTIDAAFFIGEEKMLGSIEPGKYADLVVLNGDYLRVPDDRIDELEPVLTVVGGKVVFDATAR